MSSRFSPRRVAATLAFVATLAVLAVVVAGRVAERRHRTVRDAWRAAAMPIDDMTVRYPDMDDNATARAVEESAVKLGLELSTQPGHPTAAPEAVEWLEGFRAALREHLDHQNERPDDVVDELPEKVRAALESRRTDLDALRDAVVAGPPPAWERRLSRHMDAPVPNLRALMDLHGMLLARALEAARSGRDEEAAREAEASWQLNVALRERPELIAQFIALAVCRMQAAALRKLDGLPPAWEARMGEHDYRKSLLAGFAADAWATAQMIDLASAPGERPAGAMLLRPWFLLQVVDYLDKRRQVVEAMAHLDPCRRDDAAIASIESIEPARWNTMGQVAWGNFTSSWNRVVRLSWSLELTGKVIAARAARRATPDGAWPAQIPGIEASMCRDNGWRYEVTPAGEMTLALEKEIAWEEPSVTKRPTPFTFEASPRPAAVAP